MSEKIKVGNAEIEKVNYDYFLSQYSKMSKKYVIADLVSKCENYEKLYNAYEKLEVEKIQKENIIKEVEKFVEEVLSSTKGVINDYMYNEQNNKERIELLEEDIEIYKCILEILDKGEQNGK